ncbi:MAG: hypothetical protein ACJAXK_001408 [Yoonia sp.]|jgi:hypothetical protein
MTLPQNQASTRLIRPEIVLSDSHFIAEGSGRRIYHHPDLPKVVIKLHKDFRTKPLIWLHNILRRNRRRFGPLMHSFVEIDEVAAAVARTGKVPLFATQFVGFVQTNLGTGARFEAMTQADGTLARNLLDHAHDTPHEQAILDAIDQLWDDVLASRVVVSDPSLRNAIVTGERKTGYRLVLIDGLGERTLIPIQSLSKSGHRVACTKARTKMKQAYLKLVSGD